MPQCAGGPQGSTGLISLTSMSTVRVSEGLDGTLHMAFLISRRENVCHGILDSTSGEVRKNCGILCIKACTNPV